MQRKKEPIKETIEYNCKFHAYLTWDGWNQENEKFIRDKFSKTMLELTVHNVIENFAGFHLYDSYLLPITYATTPKCNAAFHYTANGHADYNLTQYSNGTTNYRDADDFKRLLNGVSKRIQEEFSQKFPGINFEVKCEIVELTVPDLNDLLKDAGVEGREL